MNGDKELGKVSSRRLRLNGCPRRRQDVLPETKCTRVRVICVMEALVSHVALAPQSGQPPGTLQSHTGTSHGKQPWLRTSHRAYEESYHRAEEIP